MTALYKLSGRLWRAWIRTEMGSATANRSAAYPGGDFVPRSNPKKSRHYMPTGMIGREGIWMYWNSSGTVVPRAE